MLAANETVAEHFHWMKKPFIYRVHEDPKEEKLIAFMEFITTFGYSVRGRGNTVHPRALQQLLEEVKGTPEEIIISTVLLRSMKQARYDAESLGHFGLATDFYTHFTSPIRRYPDLIVHRLIRQWIEQGVMSGKREEQWAERLPEIAEHTSRRERVAVDAERETDDLKKAEFMLERIGEEFEGVISGVTSFGLFIELPNTIEGLVHVSFLTDDYYHYHEKAYALIGERTGKQYRIGDVVEVRVAKVNVEERAIDFEIVGMKKANTFRHEGRSRGAKVIEGNAGRGGRGGKREKGRRKDFEPAAAKRKRANERGGRKPGAGAGAGAQQATGIVSFKSDGAGAPEGESAQKPKQFWEDLVNAKKKRKNSVAKPAKRKRK